MDEINRIYVRKTDFKDKYECQEYINKLINTLTSVESNIVVAYQSMDPNIYIIECNTSDPTLNGVFPFWVTPEELLAIKQHRETSDNSKIDFDDENSGGLA